MSQIGTNLGPSHHHVANHEQSSSQDGNIQTIKADEAAAGTNAAALPD
jgi:hypothetical protein